MVTAQKRRETDSLTWWDSNSTGLWRMMLLLLLGYLSFMGAYLFTETTNFPKVYVEKVELITIRAEIINQINDARKERIAMMKDIRLELQQQFEVVNRKIDDTNSYLRKTKGNN